MSVAMTVVTMTTILVIMIKVGTLVKLEHNYVDIEVVN